MLGTGDPGRKSEVTSDEKLKVLREAVQEIRELTFDECFEVHGLRGECRKPEQRDWARIQSIAAKVLRVTE